MTQHPNAAKAPQDNAQGCHLNALQLQLDVQEQDQGLLQLGIPAHSPASQDKGLQRLLDLNCFAGYVEAIFEHEGVQSIDESQSHSGVLPAQQKSS